MSDKRQYPRYPCNIKVAFEFFEGDPETIDTETAVPSPGDGFILDMSKGGLFIVSNARVGINQPIRLKFSTKKKEYHLEGTIVRTGLLKHNPSEVARRFAKKKVKGDSYIAIAFITPLDELSDKDL